MQLTPKEKRNKQVGAAVSVGAHVAVLIFLFFMVAWRAPDPPLPEIGIELNFGTENAGSGAEQPEPFTTPTVSEQPEEAAPDGIKEDNQEEVLKDIEATEDPIETENVPEESVEEAVKEQVPTNNTTDSPDVVSDSQKAKTTKEPPKEKPMDITPKPKAPPILYPNTKAGAGGNEGKKEPQKANQGDKPGNVGDQGDPNGSVDARALYGKAGGGGGTSLQMSGWMWDFEPKPIDNSSESGRLVFQVIIDDKGTIIRVKTVESGVSPSLEKIYRDEVLKLTFSKTSGSAVATTSTGTITFVIKAN